MTKTIQSDNLEKRVNQNQIKKLLGISKIAGQMAVDLRDTGLIIEKKADKSRVTQADLRLNSYLVHEISQLFPHDQVLGEESYKLEDIDSRKTVWYVDPIDGTDAFIEGLAEWAIHIGRATNGVADFGLVYRPDTSECYYGGKGTPPMCTQDGEHWETLTIIPPSEELCAIDSRHRKAPLVQSLEEKGHIKKVIKMSSLGLKAMEIASSRAHIYFNNGQCSLWDTCAPEGILADTDIGFFGANQAPLRYRPEELGSLKVGAPFLICHKNILEKIFNLIENE